MIHMKLKFLGISSALAVLAFLAGCKAKNPAPAAGAPKDEMSPVQVVGMGRIEPEGRILDLQSEVAGIVTRIPVRPGDAVSQGQVLIELTSAIEKARLDQAAAQVRSQRSQIDAARAALASARIKTDNAGLTFERAKILFEQDAQAKFSFDAAKADYDSLREEVKRLEAGVVAAENGLNQSSAGLELAQAEFDRRFIRARSEGQVLSLDIAVGSLLSPDKAFGTFAPRGLLVARCEIDELYAGEVKAGQKAYVRVPGMTEPLAGGEVTFAGPSLRKKSLFSDAVGDLEDRRVREVWITLDPGARILFGSRVECVIRLKES
jgi:multidrug efflux pump subunit AcrA (membrane-fusion protein)